MKLYIGCGHKRPPGYIAIDADQSVQPDVCTDASHLPYVNESVDEIWGEAVFEHIWPHEMKAALEEWSRVLKHGGLVKMYWIPNFDEVCRFYLRNIDEPKRCTTDDSPKMDLATVRCFTHGMVGNRLEDVFQSHKDIYTISKVRKIFEDAGFTVLKVGSACFRDETLAVNINVEAIRP